jgi:uncharacterized damage-inducible protein DinB
VTLQDLQELLDYHYWARDRVLEAAEGLSPDQLTRDMGNSFKSVRDTLVHIYGAEHVWLQRWNGESPSGLPRADEFADVAAIRTAWIAQEAKVRAFIDALSDRDVERVIEYKLFSGQTSATLLWQLVHHLVNHASYHRGQVTTLLRQLGAATPRGMDAIAYYRERSQTARA